MSLLMPIRKMQRPYTEDDLNTTLELEQLEIKRAMRAITRFERTVNRRCTEPHCEEKQEHPAPAKTQEISP